MFRNPLEERGGGACSKVERGQNQNWLPQPCLRGAQKWAEMLRHPCFLGDPQQRGQNQSTKKKQKKNKNKKFTAAELNLHRVLQTASGGA